MHTHQIYVLRARDRAQDIRQELFEFPEVLDVFVTGRPDCLVVVSQGRPRLAEWLRALRARGFELPARRHASRRAPDGEDSVRPRENSGRSGDKRRQLGENRGQPGQNHARRREDRRRSTLNGGEPRPEPSRRGSPRRAAAVSSGAGGEAVIS